MMRATALLSSLLLLSAVALAQAPDTARTFALRCGTLYVGDGTSLTDATVLVDGGRITAVGAGSNAPEVPPGTRIVDASEKVVMPGIVVADTDLSGHGDGAYNVTPDFIALDGFDFLRKRYRALSGGVTTVYLSPGRDRLVSGQGSVVKMAGDDLVTRVLNETACLRIDMGEEATRAPAVFEPTPVPTSDNPLLPARKQYPSSRISLLPELHRLFRQALTLSAGGGTDGDLFGPGPAEDHYGVRPLQLAAQGQLPLRIAAKEAADIRRALQLATSMHAPLVLEDPWQIAPVAAAAADAGARAVFRLPVMPGASNPGGENREDRDAPHSSLDNPAVAAAAGLRFALAPRRDDDLSDVLMVAGLAMRHRLSEVQAMRSLTSDAAAVLGVDDRVGTIAAGKDADLLVLSGAPFAIGTMVEQTWVNGERVYERHTESTLLAVRAGRILTLAGPSYDHGVLIAQNGKIKAVGEDLAIPYGARVIDLGDSVMVPGFIDAYSHLGLAGHGSGIPAGAPDQRIADVVRHDDPMFHAAVEAGLTTVMVSGKDAGTVSGRVAALKTAAADQKSMVVAETAAVRFVHDAIGPDAIKPLADAIGRGRKYLEAWQKYDKAMAEYRAGKGKKPKEEKPAEEAPVEDPVTGSWEVTLSEPPPIPIDISLDLQLDGKKVTGSLVFSIRGRDLTAEIEDGRYENGKLTGRVRAPMVGEAEVEATVKDDTMEGTIRGQRNEQSFTAKRVAKGAPKARTHNGKSSDDGEPKKPKVDESLEPLRALLEKKIPAIVKTERAPAIKSVIDWFEGQKLPFVLTGLKDAIESPDVLGDTKPAVLLGPDVVRREGNKLTNAPARLDDHGSPVAFGTGDTAGSAFLPVHAALAVRYGMDPNEALKALTLYPARMFKVDGRIGSLERGKDADFVVFSGSPFEMTSVVQLVVVNGRVVVDNREGRR